MKNPDTQFLRALAIIVIVNSHMDRFYPVPYLATGGAIGNSIFFFLSAFGLYISQQDHVRNFSEWYTRRIGRIYPSLWIVLISLYMPLLIWQGKLSFSTTTTYMGCFFYPPFDFLQMLLVYYLLTFPLIKNVWKADILVILGLLSLLYVGCYVSIVDLSRWSVEDSPFDLIHYLMVFLFGIFIAKKNKEIAYSGFRDYIFFFSLIGLIYAHKYFMLKGLLLDYQFLQQISMYPILYYLLKISRCPFIMGKVANSPGISRAVDFVANHTLEIYMVHLTIRIPVLHMQMPFPVNLFVFLILTLCLSLMVNKLAQSFRKSLS